MKRKVIVLLFNICLFLLVFENELHRIYFFAKLPNLSQVMNYFELTIYVILAVIILNNKYTLKEFIIIAIFTILLFIGYLNSKNAVFLRGLFLIAASKNIPFKTILKTCRYSVTLTFLISITLFVLGISDAGTGRRGAISIGYGHPNQAAQVMLIMYLLWLVEKEPYKKKMWMIKSIIIDLIVYLITGSRTTCIIWLIIPFTIIFTNKVLNKDKKGKFIKIFSTLIQTLFLFFSYITAKILPISNFAYNINALLSGRLFMNYYCLEKYGLTLFGQNVELKDVSGTIYNNIINAYNWNVTVDSSYMASLIIMGIIPTIIFLIGYIILVRKAIKNKDYIVMIIAVALAFYSFNESQMLEIYNNFVYFYILSDTLKKNKVIENKKIDYSSIKNNSLY